MKSYCIALIVYFVHVGSQFVSTEEVVTCKEASDNQKRCEEDGQYGICFAKECYTLKTTRKPVLIQVRYNTSNRYVQSSNYHSPSMWLRGNSMGLSWTEGVKMKQSNKDTWQLLINMSLPLNNNRAKFEFRVYLNNIKDMLGANFDIALPPSTNTEHLSQLKAPSEFRVYPWFFNRKGTITRRVIYSTQLQQNRSITMYTPASFDENQYKHYETLFFNDGQRVELFLPQIEVLTVEHALMREIIVVGVVNDYGERTQLLAPTNGSNISCKSGDFANNCNNCLECGRKDIDCDYEKILADYVCYKWEPFQKVYGQLYLDFIQHTLIPETQKTYRALPGGENVGIAGFSFSGLLACHAMWTRPEVFGSAACMSSSFWWPFPGGNLTFPDKTGFEFVTKTLGEHRGVRPRQKVYIDIGSKEGAIMVDPARNATRIMASTPYFTLGENLWFYIWDDEIHEFELSLKRIWVAMTAFYGPDVAPSAPKQARDSRVNSHGNRDATQHSHLFLIAITVTKFLMF